MRRPLSNSFIKMEKQEHDFTYSPFFNKQLDLEQTNEESKESANSCHTNGKTGSSQEGDDCLAFKGWKMLKYLV